ncbi:MAG: glycosyltransferase family 4 protein [Gammaproteobacteria bacterium]|nr:glycosyltransferase family 4 protein [Gammaproteobacteria bacterium]
MRVLFLSHYFPPEVNAPATRTYEHCKEWVKQGHKVTVISCVPHHPMGKAYPGYQNRFYQVEDKDGIRAIKIWTYITANEGFVKRTWNYVFYMLMSILVAPFVGKADVVISTSPQFFNGLAGYFVSRLKRSPWVLEIRDLWPESILTVGAITNKRIIRFLEYLEMFAYRKADRIVPVTDAFKAYMIGKGIDEGKIQVITNGVNLDLYQPGETDQGLAEELGVAGKFVAAYVGTHGMAHHLETILEAAKLCDNPDIAFVMVGEGAERKKLLTMKQEMGLDNVTMVTQLPKERMPALWSITDASLVLLKKSDLFKSVIPSKIFESMAMQCPIVLGVEGEVKGIIEQAGSGICIEPESAMELVQAVKRLQSEPDVAAKMGESGRQYVAEHYNRSVLANSFEQMMKDLCGND